MNAGGARPQGQGAQRGAKDTAAIGRRGEAIAAREVEARGWQIRARNLRTPAGEADLVAGRLRGEGVDEARELLIVEVKSTAGRRELTGRVDRRKAARLWAIAEHVLDASAAQGSVGWLGAGDVHTRVALIEVRIDAAHTEVAWRWLEAW